jgi:predicted MFS family arabinose efflux permease
MSVTTEPTTAAAPSSWDTAYEWKAVTLLSLGFGLVGLDRWVLAPLFPAIMQDLHLNYQDLGNVIGILSFGWGIACIGAGALTDRIGVRRTLIPALLLFSALAGLTGLAGGLMALLVVRTVMGATEGAYLPPAMGTTTAASHPRRRGLNQGFQLSLFALIGLGFGPIIATQALEILPSWRWVFALVAAPGFILAVFIYFMIREPEHHRTPAKRDAVAAPWADMFKSRNILLTMLSLPCAMTCVFVLGAMVPNYLVDFRHLSMTQMGFVTSAIGFGGFIGEFAVPGVSDLLGRRPVCVAAFLLTAVMVYVFSQTPTDPTLVFSGLFVTSLLCFGIVAMFTGPVPTEAVSLGLVASSVGIASGVGELFGGAVAPAISGTIAQHFGIQNIVWLPIATLLLGAVLSALLVETAPCKTGQV